MQRLLGKVSQRKARTDVTDKTQSIAQQRLVETSMGYIVGSVIHLKSTIDLKMSHWRVAPHDGGQEPQGEQ